MAEPVILSDEAIVPAAVRAALHRTAQDPRPVVLLTCGIAGSGKSTLAKAVVRLHPNFTRLSIDQLVYERHGIYGKDYAADMALYGSYQDEAEEELMAAFRGLLREKRDVVLDRSFWCKADRDEIRKIVEEAGGRCVLVAFRARDPAVLWRRVQERRAKDINADSALVITEELLAQYVKGFEWPEGEGEIVIDIG